MNDFDPTLLAKVALGQTRYFLLYEHANLRRAWTETFVLEVGPRSHAGESDSNTKASVHDLRKFACSYSRKYLYCSSKSLAKRVGSKSFSTLDNRYIRVAPRVRATFQVPLGTIQPTSTAYHRLRTF